MTCYIEFMHEVTVISSLKCHAFDSSYSVVVATYSDTAWYNMAMMLFHLEVLAS